MKVNIKDLSYKSFTPLTWLGVSFLVFSALFLFQQASVFRKNQVIKDLTSENEELKKSLLALNGKLSVLNDTATDVRIFQKEIVKVIKDIETKHPAALAFASKPEPACDQEIDGEFDSQSLLKDASKNIFQLEAKQKNLWFESADLLGKAVSIRDILSKTPSMIPVNGRITSNFGIRSDPKTGKIKKHYGTDIAAPEGTPVYAAADGIVHVAASNDADFGNLIVIRHKYGYTTHYGHLRTMFVKKGEEIKRGQEIGLVGRKGARCTGPHVHYEVRHANVHQDPKEFMFSSPPNVF